SSATFFSSVYSLLQQITPFRTLPKSEVLDPTGNTRDSIHSRIAFYENSDKEDFYRQYATLQSEKGKSPSVTTTIECLERLDQEAKTDSSSNWFWMRNRKLGLTNKAIQKDGLGRFSFSKTFLVELYQVGLKEFSCEKFVLSYHDPISDHQKSLTILWQPKIALFESDKQTLTPVQVFLDEWGGEVIYRGTLRHLLACASGKNVVTALISFASKDKPTIKLFSPVPQKEATEKLRQIITSLLTPQESLFPISNPPCSKEETILSGYSGIPCQEKKLESFLDILKNALGKDKVLPLANFSKKQKPDK
ncbi:MAG: hypothetical protein ACI4QT_03375, partial [Kiritimatiellia bacterium]